MKFSNFALFGAATAMANPLMNYLVLDEVLDGTDSNDSLMKLMLLSPGLLGKFLEYLYSLRGLNCANFEMDRHDGSRKLYAYATME